MELEVLRERAVAIAGLYDERNSAAGRERRDPVDLRGRSGGRLLPRGVTRHAAS